MVTWTSNGLVLGISNQNSVLANICLDIDIVLSLDLIQQLCNISSMPGWPLSSVLCELLQATLLQHCFGSHGSAESRLPGGDTSRNAEIESTPQADDSAQREAKYGKGQS